MQGYSCFELRLRGNMLVALFIVVIGKAIAILFNQLSNVQRSPAYQIIHFVLRQIVITQFNNRLSLSSVLLGIKPCGNAFSFLVFRRFHVTVDSVYKDRFPKDLDISTQDKILKKTTTLLNLQNMFRQKLLSSSVD